MGKSYTAAEAKNIIGALDHIVQEEFPRYPCIAVSAFVIEVLQAMGETAAYALPVIVRIEKSTLPQPIAIGIGQSTTTEWAGHLTVVWPVTIDGISQTLLLDFTVRQANVPPKNAQYYILDLPAIVCPVTKQFLNGETASTNIDGSVVTYEPQLANDTYKTTSDWAHKGDNKALVEDTLTFIAELAKRKGL